MNIIKMIYRLFVPVKKMTKTKCPHVAIKNEIKRSEKNIINTIDKAHNKTLTKINDLKNEVAKQKTIQIPVIQKTKEDVWDIPIGNGTNVKEILLKKREYNTIPKDDILEKLVEKVNSSSEADIYKTIDSIFDKTSR